MVTSSSTTTNATGVCPYCGNSSWYLSTASVMSPTYTEKTEMLKALSELLFNKLSPNLSEVVENKIKALLETI